MPLEDRSEDLVTASYLVHELPADSTRSFLRDARRVLKPKGVVALVDGDPWYVNVPFAVLCCSARLLAVLRVRHGAVLCYALLQHSAVLCCTVLSARH